MTSFRMTSKLFCAAFWWLGLALLYVPVLTLIVYSFVNMNAGGGVSLEGYIKVIQSERITEALKSSLLIATFSATISTSLGGLAAWGLERGRSRFDGVLETLAMAPLVLPEVVFGLGLLIWFVLLRVRLGAVSLILAHVTFSLSYVILTVRGRAKLLDPAIDDAARDLGASGWQLFSRIQLPLLAPALFAGWMMAFTLSFDDFLISFFTSGPDTVTLPIALYGIIKFGVGQEVFAIASCVFAVSFVSASLVARFSRA